MRRFALALLPLVALLGCADPHRFDALHPQDAVVTLQAPDRPAGRGFFVATDGTIVTCLHLLNDGKPVTVVLPDGRHVEGAVLNEDREQDIAIVKVPNPPEGHEFKVLHLNDEDIIPGMRVRVAGGQGVTHGTFDHWEDFGHSIDFTAPVKATDAGAPLLADDNRVIGIVLGPFEQHGKAAKAYVAARLVPHLAPPPQFGKE